MNAKWTIDAKHSDVLIEARHSVLAYLEGGTNEFNGYVVMDDNIVEDAAVEFSLNVNHNYKKIEPMSAYSRLSDLFDQTEDPTIRFKSTSFQKVNKNINFIKGELTIKNVTKTLELDTEFMGMTNYDGHEKALFELSTKIKRSDFDLGYQSNPHSGIAIGQDIKLVANLEFAM